MMHSITILLLVAIGGAGLGLFFFGGLWMTVQRLRRTAHPMAFLVGSFAVRLVITLAGLALLTQGRIDRVAAALVGFFLTRLVLLQGARRLSPVSLPGREIHGRKPDKP